VISSLVVPEGKPGQPHGIRKPDPVLAAGNPTCRLEGRKLSPDMIARQVRHLTQLLKVQPEPFRLVRLHLARPQHPIEDRGQPTAQRIAESRSQTAPYRAL
jgi:hypothetical protein